MVVFELICYDAQSLDDKDEKGMEKDKYSFECKKKKKKKTVRMYMWKEIKERRRNLT